MNRDTYVIIPVFNEDAVARKVVNEVCKRFSNVVCVNDASTDDTAQELAVTPATVLRHETNQGQGAALRTGISYALDQGATYYITFDADGQHKVKDALAMLRVLRANSELDIVLGSRFLGSAPGISRVKRSFLKCAVLFSNLTTGIKLTDTHNGLRVFNHRFAANLKLRCNGMAHASEFMLRIADKGYHYQEQPVTIEYTNYSKLKGQSMFNTFNILKELYFTKN